MAVIPELQVIHAIMCNVIDDTSMNDPRMRALHSVRDGLSNLITELE